MSTTQGRKIAIVGAAGNLGREILAGLLGKGIHTITAISRNDSNATFPDGVRVLKGDYADEGFLSSALEGQEVLVLALAYFASKQQIPLIRAAAKAGIRYVLPVEFGSDPNATELLKALQMTAEKKVYRDLSESVGVSWIAVVSNPWFDWSLAGGHWGFDIKSRTVDLYDGGAAKFVTTTIRTTGQATAGLLSLPENELAEFKNAPLYLMSFRISQQDILQSLLRVTNTQEKDWNVQLQDGEKSAAKAREEAAKGSFEASIKAHYVPHMIDGLGGDYSAKVLDMRRLGVEPEDLDTVVKTVVQGLE